MATYLSSAAQRMNIPRESIQNQGPNVRYASVSGTSKVRSKFVLQQLPSVISPTMLHSSASKAMTKPVGKTTPEQDMAEPCPRVDYNSLMALRTGLERLRMAYYLAIEDISALEARCAVERALLQQIFDQNAQLLELRRELAEAKGKCSGYTEDRSRKRRG